MMCTKLLTRKCRKNTGSESGSNLQWGHPAKARDPTSVRSRPESHSTAIRTRGWSHATPHLGCVNHSGSVVICRLLRWKQKQNTYQGKVWAKAVTSNKLLKSKKKNLFLTWRWMDNKFALKFHLFTVSILITIQEGIFRKNSNRDDKMLKVRQWFRMLKCDEHMRPSATGRHRLMVRPHLIVSRTTREKILFFITKRTRKKEEVKYKWIIAP